MAIVLFTDFGSNDLYVGQLEAALDRDAPGIRVIHLLHEAPAFNPRASAHLLAALASRMQSGHVYVAVVDPGVGSARDAVAIEADGRWFVGPDNGLLSVVAARAVSCRVWRVGAVPAEISVSFHGRDLFAPLAAAIARGELPDDLVARAEGLAVALGDDDLAEIIYADHYGNLFTGIRAHGIATDRRLVARGDEIGHGKVFSSVPAGTAFWYENSLGLVEIAANGGSAVQLLGLGIGEPVSWASG
jgi:S-adenosyl-L-methionine hydrolase (adenosine-forming)